MRESMAARIGSNSAVCILSFTVDNLFTFSLFIFTSFLYLLSERFFAFLASFLVSLYFVHEGLLNSYKNLSSRVFGRSQKFLKETQIGEGESKTQ